MTPKVSNPNRLNVEAPRFSPKLPDLIILENEFPFGLNHLNVNAPIFSPKLSSKNPGNESNPTMSHLNIKAHLFTPHLLQSQNSTSVYSNHDSTPPILEVGTPNCSINVSFQSLNEGNINHESAVSNSTLDNFHENTTDDSVNDCSTSPNKALQSLRIKNSDRILIGSLNINSVRSKIGLLEDLVSERIDILLLCETKIDNSFPDAQFELNGFAEPQRLDRTVHGGGLLLYFRNGITNKPLKLVSNQIECMIREVRISNKKWLIFGIYNHQKSEISSFLSALSENLCHYLPLYDNVLLIGDFNSEISEKPMEEFCSLFDLKSLIKTPTCYMSDTNPSCIDLILTNRSNCF